MNGDANENNSAGDNRIKTTRQQKVNPLSVS